ncbi:hypothetical protein AJ80_00190 [Polytolypa hystricis UAMH7299]|uniref:T6SS Phospholipase effector Tle1-like catalytic domain-containing protein n=1 Tax=Polytolypa hystricis (strain UAMH7299) TaxID=1447883 RepID=A0A2B7Z1X1_POLH7|nr:hypothetical protein AJ80_00190 [Polytolypa hystricis UAMH7299]
MVTTQQERNPRRLVLCFDGTGNVFTGDESDTNVVKIYDMLDRFRDDQFHYYQPGIGTFHAGAKSLSPWGRFKERFWLAMDQALGTSFEYHVSEGYKFLMRYYAPGDAIYIFGFSRGAYTARFLADMISEVGLLSQGNEDMIRFAFSSFGKVQNSRGKETKSAKNIEDARYLAKFRKTFCRPNVSVYFLGLFDCVNSVSQFEIPFRIGSYRYIAMAPAKHIRHAVSIHERRLKFKPALCMFDKERSAGSEVKEVWFAGNHCDIGGGFKYEGKSRHLLSDVPLAWMIDEILALDDQPCGKLAFDKTTLEQSPHLKAGREWAMRALIEEDEESEEGEEEMSDRQMKLHDHLTFNRGASWVSTSMWWILEVLPLFTRLELEHGEWIPRYWPPNFGAMRDIPLDAHIHISVFYLKSAGVICEMPELGGDDSPILKDPFKPMRLLLREQTS